MSTPQTFTLTQEQYEALIAFARRGITPGSADSLTLDAFLKNIEQASGITRYALWIQWQEIHQPLPPTTAFPDVWPPELRYYLEFLSRPISKNDVLAVLKLQAKQPTNVLVTKDPAAKVGWTPIDSFFIQ
jgi:hypothetical protein